MSKGTVRINLDTKDVHRAVDAAIAACEPPAVTDALVAAMTVIQKGAQDRAPHKTGALARSIELQVTGPTSVSVGTDSPYSFVQEFGATIRAHKQKLEFNGKSGVVFVRKVTIRAQPYFLPAFTQDSPAAETAFGDEFDRNFTK
jgi:HK97 gp10 family phage protein